MFKGRQPHAGSPGPAMGWGQDVGDPWLLKDPPKKSFGSRQLARCESCVCVFMVVF